MKKTKQQFANFLNPKFNSTCIFEIILTLLEIIDNDEEELKREEREREKRGDNWGKVNDVREMKEKREMLLIR